MCNEVIITVLFWCFCFVTSSSSTNRKASQKCGQVHLTVSSFADTYLELNWITQCTEPEDVSPDYIALYKSNIKNTTEETLPLVKIRASDYSEGYYKTNITFGQSTLPGNWEYNSTLATVNPGPHCFPLWITSMKDNKTIDTRCLAIQPTWMNDNRLQIGRLKIGNLFIPGTHNSGAYTTGTGFSAYFRNYTLTQDRDIWTQLVHGIRYLDLRIGYYEGHGFFLNHDLFVLTEVIPVLEQIKKFLQLAPKEVIVIDFHRFPHPSNFTTALHDQWVSLVREYLGDLALPSTELEQGKEPTLNDIWAKKKNLLICYGENPIVKKYNWLWPPLRQHWANTMSLETLKTFLSRAMTQKRDTVNPMVALMAEFTLQVSEIITGVLVDPDGENDLHKLASIVNREITMWFRDEWAMDTNIVATDYFLGNDIIKVAIEANIDPKRRKKSRTAC